MTETRSLVVVAHPDDEVLGCGGTMSLLAREGGAVRVVILGEGETSRTHAQADGPELLREAAQRASKLLAVEELRFHELPDNRFDTVPLLDVVKLVEYEYFDFEPDHVYTQYGGDLNIDHEITCRAVLTATRPQTGRACEVLAFEVRSSTDWSNHLPGHSGFLPNVWQVLDEDAVAAKQRALREYQREMRAWPHSRSHEAVDALVRHRGAQVGASAAEAFMLLHSVRAVIA